MNSLNEIILNYNDSLIYESDLGLLKEGNWLNDRIIGFCCDYFENEIFKQECERKLLAFVNPSTVQYLKLCESLEEAKMCFLEPLVLQEKKVIFLPLNNNKTTQAGGCHWSLLLIDNRNSKMIHYDSIGSNSDEASLFFYKFKEFFDCKELLNEEKFPKQTNNSDCGAYVLAAIELIAENVKKNNEISLPDIKYNLISEQYISDLRKKLI
ncbi:unnamed protein product [Brachionus calyciflorus]|uniref:Ubiquitin-like protease family profile domain-containing protein n=1 Tax=Brachionus calyciflorus TaxID=104777 RepID=A0A813MDB9_9BILA|nr:unnamed protein product [Brachionus calyciflorus]